MAFMVMKLKSGSKTYALKIPKNDFVAIQKDPSLLAEYWDQVLEDEKGEQEQKPQVGRPPKRRSKSVGAEAKGRKKAIPHDEKIITNRAIHYEKKKEEQKDYGKFLDANMLITKSKSAQQAAPKSLEIPVSVQDTNSVDDTGDTDVKNKIKGLDCGNKAGNKKVKPLKGSNKSDEKGDEVRKPLNSKSVFNDDECLEPKKVPVCEENIKKYSNTGCTESELWVKDKTLLKQPIKSYSKGFRKLKKGVNFLALDEQLVEPLGTPMDEENIQVHNSNETELVHTTNETSSLRTKKLVKFTKQVTRSDDTGILPDLHVTQVTAAPKRRGQKRKHIELCEGHHTTPKQLVDQDTDSTTVFKDISSDVTRCSPPEKLNEVAVHADMEENRSSPNAACRRSVRQQQRQQKQGEIKCAAFSPSRGSVLPQVETYISDSSISGEISLESQLKMSSVNSSQKMPSVGLPQVYVPQTIKFVTSPMKTLSSISQTLPVVCASGSTEVPPKLILHTPFHQDATVTPVQIKNFTPLSASTPYVAFVPGPQPTQTTKITHPLPVSATVPLSAVSQGIMQQTVQLNAAQNLAPTTVSSLPMISAHPATLQPVPPKVVSQSTSLISALPNSTQAAPALHVPHGNNCQLVHCLQTPCLAQSEVVTPAASQTISVTPKTVLDHSPTQSSVQVAPVKKMVKMTLKEVSAAIKKSPQQITTVFHPVMNVRQHDLETLPQKLSAVKAMNIIASPSASQHILKSSREQDSRTTATHTAQRSGCPTSSLKSVACIKSKNIDPVYVSKRKLSEVVSKVEQSGVPKDLSEVEAKLSTQNTVVKLGDTSGVATSVVAIQNGKFIPYDVSGVKTLKAKSSSQLNPNNLLLGETKSLSFDNLKTSLAKKLPSKPESDEKKLNSCKNVVQKGMSVEDAALSDKVSILLVPIGMSPTPQTTAEVNVTHKLLCSSSKARKRNLLDAESFTVGPKSRKHNKISVTKGEKDMTLEASDSAEVIHLSKVDVYSPPKSRCAVPSAKCMPADLSQTLDFKIIHPLTPVQPPISDVSQKMSSAKASSGTSKDNSGVTSSGKVPKTTTYLKEIEPKISQEPTGGAICETLVDVPHNVPNVSTSSSLGPSNAVQSEFPSHRDGVPSIHPVVNEVTLGADKTSKLTELQCSTVAVPGLKAFEKLLNEGLDSITQLLAEKAFACKGTWDTVVCYSFLSECLKGKDTFFNSSAKDLNFETVCCSMNRKFPELNTTVSDCNERWWEFLMLYEILTKKLDCYELNECFLIPEKRRKAITMICQAMAYRKYPLSYNSLQERNRNDRVNAALKFLNDSLENEMASASACKMKGTSLTLPQDFVHQTSDTRQLGLVDLFMLLAIKIQQFTQSTTFFADYIEETLIELAEGHSTS